MLGIIRYLLDGGLAEGAGPMLFPAIFGQFDNAKKLWNQKLQPLLEFEHHVTWQELQDGQADPQVKRRFENDARLLKTLLLAALVARRARDRAPVPDGRLQ